MKLKTFKRGIHPHDGKSLSAESPIRRIPAVGDCVYPLSQHIGAPAVPVVGVGDRVLAGQKIAEAGGFVSAPIYTSVSGTVKAIGPHPSSSGETVPSITIENDGQSEWLNPTHDPENCPFANNGDAVKAALTSEPLASMDKAAIRAAIREAGIVGLGGAGFPAVVKLTPKNDDEIDRLIINAAECEPYLTSDYRLMMERPHELLAGCQLLLRLFPKATCIIGVENNKPAAIKLLAELCKDYKGITVCPLKAKYPQGGERMLIKAITGRELNSTLLPSAVGCIVMNVASVIASFRACALGQPLTHRVMTVTGDGVQSPCNLEVPIGISHRAVMEAAGGFAGEPGKIISGGPMMGTALFTTDIPVTKTSASVLALAKDPVALHDTSACIRCGKCLKACPERLVPTKLAEAAEADDFESFEKFGGMECIECGSCAYVCPAKRYLVQSMRYGKRKTGAIIRERKAAEQSKANDTAAKGGNKA
ncbi:MAG: electron transport complex subunit RsxC [Clostridia bacterium]|nr:electron transport complex subunit RsxC [Clostridia bacterium]